MSSPLQNNITNLQELLEQVNALPKADGSGGSVNTCTVQFTFQNATISKGVYMKHENGTTSLVELGLISSNTTLENVVSNSIIWIYFNTP